MQLAPLIASRTLGLMLFAAAALPLPAATPGAEAWDFQVTLDGKPIGEHRFDLSVSGDRRQLVSQARFVVKFLGITAYRYSHQAVEQWQGDCLSGLSAETDDDGRALRVHAEGGVAGLRVDTDGGSAPAQLPGCVMSFAYWNPAMRRMNRLLNAQTGVAERVQVSRMDDAAIEVHGRPVSATRWRITGAAAPIDVWYARDGEWVGLDSKLTGGRLLSYRLK
jgi:hypothetical protein